MENYVKLRNLALLPLFAVVSGCLATYPEVQESNSAAFIQFERNIADPLLGSITRYVNIDNNHKCHESYPDQKLMAVHNKGNPLVSDLHVNGLYVNPEKNFRILMSTVAGGAWCDVIVRMDVEAGEKYKIIASGDVHIGVNQCSAKLYKQINDNQGQKVYKETTFKEYLECNK